MRFVLLALAIVVLLWLLRRALLRSGRKADLQEHPTTEGELVRCAHCGVYLPRGEARGAGDALYCSEEHARLGPRGE